MKFAVCDSSGQHLSEHYQLNAAAEALRRHPDCHVRVQRSQGDPFLPLLSPEGEAAYLSPPRFRGKQPRSPGARKHTTSVAVPFEYLALVTKSASASGISVSECICSIIMEHFGPIDTGPDPQRVLTKYEALQWESVAALRISNLEAFKHHTRLRELLAAKRAREAASANSVPGVELGELAQAPLDTAGGEPAA